MDEITKLNDELKQITLDIESIENSECEDCSYSILRKLILRHENVRKCQKDIRTIKHLKCDFYTVSAIRVLMKDLIKRGEIRIHELEKMQVTDSFKPCGETHLTT